MLLIGVIMKNKVEWKCEYCISSHVWMWEDYDYIPAMSGEIGMICAVCGKTTRVKHEKDEYFISIRDVK